MKPPRGSADESVDDSRLDGAGGLAEEGLDQTAGELEARATTRRRHSRVVDALSLHLSLAVCDPGNLTDAFAGCQGIFPTPNRRPPIGHRYVQISVSHSLRRSPSIEFIDPRRSDDVRHPMVAPATEEIVGTGWPP